MSFSSLLYSAFRFAGSAFSSTPTSTPQSIVVDQFVNSNAFYALSLLNINSLTTQLLAPTNQFYTVVISPGTVVLTSPNLVNTNTFYSPTVSRGPVNVTVGLLASTNQFYSISTLASISIGDVILINPNQFYAPTVTAGSVTLLGTLFQNTNIVYSAEIVQPFLATVPFVPSTSYFNLVELTRLDPIYTPSKRQYDRDTPPSRTLNGGVAYQNYSRTAVSFVSYINTSTLQTYTVIKPINSWLSTFVTPSYTSNSRNLTFMVSSKTLSVNSPVRT